MRHVAQAVIDEVELLLFQCLPFSAGSGAAERAGGDETGEEATADGSAEQHGKSE